MKKLLLLAILVSMTNLYGDESIQNDQYADCRKERPNGRVHTDHYLSIFGDTSPLTSPIDTAIQFTHESVRSFGFEHPVNGDNTKVEVNHKGVYLIDYSLDVSTTTSATGIISTNLVVNDEAVLSTSRSVEPIGPSGQTLNISNSFILKLKKEDIVQLFIHSTVAGSIIVGIPILTITQISGS